MRLSPGPTRAGSRSSPSRRGRVKSSRAVLETIAEYVHEQGLTKERVRLEDVFWKSTLEL